MTIEEYEQLSRRDKLTWHCGPKEGRTAEEEANLIHERVELSRAELISDLTEEEVAEAKQLLIYLLKKPHVFQALSVLQLSIMINNYKITAAKS